MAKDLLVQAELRSGPTVYVCWVDPYVHEGDTLELDGDEVDGRVWTAVRVYSLADGEGLRRERARVL